MTYGQILLQVFFFVVIFGVPIAFVISEVWRAVQLAFQEPKPQPTTWWESLEKESDETEHKETKHKKKKSKKKNQDKCRKSDKRKSKTR